MDRWWWWTGAHDAFNKKRPSDGASKPSAGQNVALVVGSTGIVGAALVDILPLEDTPGGPWRVYAISHRPLPPWSAAASPRVSRSQFDLADDEDLLEALKPLTDITHVFYVAWDPRPTDGVVDDCAIYLSDVPVSDANCAMLHRVISFVVRNCPNLVHVCLQTERKHFIVDPFEPLPPYPYSEDLETFEHPDLEDALREELASREVTWSVHRPTTIFGFSPRSSRNVVANLCVYGAICREEGAVLRWPGSRVAWEGFSDASDAELVAEQQIWAALQGENQVFNCSNGDVYKWKRLRPILASHFGVDWAGYEGEDRRFKLEDAMAGKEALWAQMVDEKRLQETELGEITNWPFVDALFDRDGQYLDTMNKSKAYIWVLRIPEHGEVLQ